MTRAAYLRLCLRQPVGWLRAAAADPGPYMRPGRVALVRLAVRILEGRTGQGRV